MYNWKGRGSIINIVKCLLGRSPLSGHLHKHPYHPTLEEQSVSSRRGQWIHHIRPLIPIQKIWGENHNWYCKWRKRWLSKKSYLMRHIRLCVIPDEVHTGAMAQWKEVLATKHGFSLYLPYIVYGMYTAPHILMWKGVKKKKNRVQENTFIIVAQMILLSQFYAIV